jgi:hypothetical protein
MHSWMNLRSARRGGALLLVSLLAACGGESGGGEPEKSGPPLPAGVNAIAADARIAMPAGQDPACQPASIRKVFREPAEWNGYWQFGLPERCPRPALPAGFDWSKEMMVFVTMGRRDSPADSITVQGSGVVGDSVLVVVRRTTRASGCDEPEVRTWPRDLVRVPATKQPAKFAEQHVRHPCPAA